MGGPRGQGIDQGKRVEGGDFLRKSHLVERVGIGKALRISLKVLPTKFEYFACCVVRCFHNVPGAFSPGMPLCTLVPRDVQIFYYY